MSANGEFMFRTESMARLIKLSLVLIVVSITTLPVFSFDGSNSLLTIPSAKLPAIGTTRVGVFNEVVLSDEATVHPFMFGSYSFSDFLYYGIQVSDDFYASHHLQATPYYHVDVDNQIKYDLGLGARNITSVETPNEYQKQNMYAVLSIDLLKSNSTYHVGAMTKKEAERKLYFMSGIEHEFKFGKLMADWDGDSLSFGLNYEVWDKYELFASNTVPKTNDTKSIIKAGIRFTGNNLRDAYRQPYKIKKEMNKTSASDQLELSNVSIMNAATFHMQKGLQHYYEANYIEALKDYKIVTSLVPENPVNYIRLGSIYYQIGEKDNAIAEWKKVLDIDPYNKEIRHYLKDVKRNNKETDQKDTELETIIEGLIKDSENKRDAKRDARNTE
jgi:tetratricopeptide (TPR) repeat protein